MNAEYLFIINYSVDNTESSRAAADLYRKYAPRTRRTALMSSIDDLAPKHSEEAGAGPWAHKVGIYAVAEANVTLKNQQGPTSATQICEFLDSQKESLGIKASDLGKIVIVTCNGADTLKRNVIKQDMIEINKKPNDKARVELYNQKQEANQWNASIKAAITETASGYSAAKNKEQFIKESNNADLRLFACALAGGGAFPKIAAWDTGLFVRSDGKKSTKETTYTGADSGQEVAKNGPEITPSRRLLSKVMFKLEKSDSGQLTGVLLDERSWTDKPV